MKSRFVALTFAMSVLAVGVAGPAMAQSREAQARPAEHSRFDDHDRQVVNTWYGQHSKTPPVGLRDRDRFAPDVEARFDVGFVLTPSLRSQVHTIPSELSRQLPPPPRNHRYVFIGGHLVLLDNTFPVRDVIHLGHGR